MSDHYFTAEPVSAARLRTVRVSLAGQTHEVQLADGVFSASALDRGTAVLLDKAPPPPASGRFVDLGCGWGPIALTLALRSPEAQVDAVDVNERALELTRVNATALGCTGIRVSRPEDCPPGGIDLLWSNPAIRIGKAELHEMLRTWLTRLAPDGRAYLVVAKKLGAESLMAWISTELGLRTERYARDKGFWVIEVSR